MAYTQDDTRFKANSTEPQTLALVERRSEGERLKVILQHRPTSFKGPRLQLELDVWSYEEPILLMRHTSRNISESAIKDLAVYEVMDFDLGGPASYRDDYAEFDPSSGTMHVYDQNGVHVLMTSRPMPTAWEMTIPTRLRLDQAIRDLEKNTHFGPQDLSVALHWPLGDLAPGASCSVDTILVAGMSLEETRDLVNRGWLLYPGKMP